MRYYALPILKLFTFLQGKKDFVLLETNKYDAQNWKSYLFFNPIKKIQLFKLDQLNTFFTNIETLSTKYFLAGYFAYELGYWLNNQNFNYPAYSLHPLIELGVYKQVLVFDHNKNKFSKLDSAYKNLKMFSLRKTKIFHLKLEISFEKYLKKIQKIQSYLKQGHTYQVNFTNQFAFNVRGCPFSFFYTLRQKQAVPYSALLQFGKHYILSFSPELFFRCKKNQLLTKPMKGTIKRGRTTEEDKKQTAFLYNDPKNRAENIMIVDLVRNDLGRISTMGKVKVKQLCTLEKYNSLWQMTSTIQSELQPDKTWLEIFKALFPCGSVTGAPKIRTMQIIQQLEQRKRGIYCGAIGFIGPKKQAAFNVPIRTIILKQKNKYTLTIPRKIYSGTMGSGGGIVFDSKAIEEFNELQLKAKFLTDPHEPFELLETILWDREFFLLSLHLKRLKDSAHYFDFPCDCEKIKKVLKQNVLHCLSGKKYKIRLFLNNIGEIRLECTPLLFPSPTKQRITLSTKKTFSHNVFLFHKTTNRALYTKEWEKYAAKGFADVIFKNEKNQITEGALSNIVIQKNTLFYTPPCSCGLLNGTYRQYFLSKKRVEETVLYERDLQTADSIYICNSVQGMRKVHLDSLKFF